jgi:hypothetical protein
MKKSWWQRFRSSNAHTQANIICTILIMVATIAYAVIAARQLGAMKSQIGEMRRNSEDASRQFQVQLKHFDAGLGRSDQLAKHAAEQAGASQQLAITAQGSLKVTTNNFREDQRAWLAVVDVQGSKPEAGQPFTNKVEVRDTGRTPAKNVAVDGIFIAYPKQMPLDFNLGLTEHKLGVLSPGGDRSILSRLGASDKLTQAEIDQFKVMDIYAYGIIRYDDIFGGHHWITYCSQLSDDRSAYTFCAQHNDTDDTDNLGK